jgi:plastocyanin
MRRAPKAGLAILVAVAFAACGGAATPTTAPAGGSTGPSAGAAACVKATTAGTVQAQIKDFAFTPASISAKVGDTITWTNNDTTPHTPALDDGTCSTDALSQGAKGSLTFSAPGTYPYHCAIHPTTMKGTIVVSG